MSVSPAPHSGCLSHQVQFTETTRVIILEATDIGSFFESEWELGGWVQGRSEGTLRGLVRFSGAGAGLKLIPGIHHVP